MAKIEAATDSGSLMLKRVYRNPSLVRIVTEPTLKRRKGKGFFATTLATLCPGIVVSAFENNPVFTSNLWIPTLYVWDKLRQSVTVTKAAESAA
jgi:hypothetical protein